MAWETTGHLLFHRLMLRKVGVGYMGADMARTGQRDPVEPEVVLCRSADRASRHQLHQVEQGGAAGDETGLGVLAHAGKGAPGNVAWTYWNRVMTHLRRRRGRS